MGITVLQIKELLATVNLINNLHIMFWRTITHSVKKFTSAFTILALLVTSIPLIPAGFAYAAPPPSGVLLFSEDFGGGTGSASLTNGWDDVPGGTAGNRDDISDDALSVGTGGTRGLLLEGDPSSNPDESAEREIVVEGYESIYIEYSRAWAGAEIDDSFVASYLLDGGSEVVLETVTGATLASPSAHALFSTTISNPDRATKLKLRFVINGSAEGDEVGIDDVKIYGTGAPLFFDGFESGDLSAWTTVGSKWTHDTGDVYSGDDKAEVKGDTAPSDDTLTADVSTVGYQNIHVAYRYKISEAFEASDHLVIEWFDGSTWTVLADYTALGTTGWLRGTHDLSAALPPDHNGDFKIRARAALGSAGDEFRFDDMVVWGEPLPAAPTVTITDIPAVASTNNFDAEFSTSGTVPTTECQLDASSFVACTSPFDLGVLSEGPHSVTVEVTDQWGRIATDTENFSVRTTGTITIDVVTDPTADPNEFAYTTSWAGGQTATDDTSYSSGELASGPYDISHATPAGWDLSSVTCSDSSEPGALVLEPNEDIVCIYTYAKRADLEIVNTAAPNEGIFKVKVTGPAPHDTGTEIQFIGEGTNTTTFTDIVPGAYIAEQSFKPAEWEGVQSYSCESNILVSPLVGTTPATPFAIPLAIGEAMLCTFNNSAYGAITGNKFRDRNADGIDNGDPGISGWGLSLYFVETNADTPPIITGTSLDGKVAGDLVSTHATVNGGNFSITQVVPAVYLLCEDSQKSGETGWHQSYPTTGSDCTNGTKGYQVDVRAQEIDSGRNFGNWKEGSIGGFKFEDLNGNGTRQNGEDRLSGWTVNLYLASDTVNPLMTDVTEANGRYLFEGLTPGEYVVREVQQVGWAHTIPDADGHTVTLLSGQNKNNLHFGNVEVATVSGVKWEDTNADGTRALTEIDVVPNFTIQAIPVDGVGDLDPTRMTKTTTTNNAGEYQFSFLAGDYGIWRISEAQTTGWVQTFPTLPTYYEVNIQPGNIVTGQDFGNWEMPTVTGMKWSDTTPDGMFALGELPVPDWPFFLARRIDPAPPTTPIGAVPIELVALSLTGNDGNYSFRPTEPGEYFVIEGNDGTVIPRGIPTQLTPFFDVFQPAPLPGLTPTTPPGTSGSWEVDSFFDVFFNVTIQSQPKQFTVDPHHAPAITVGPSGELITVPFGNMPVPRITPMKWLDIDADGVWDQGLNPEPPIPNWPMALGRVTQTIPTVEIEIVALSLTGQNGVAELLVPPDLLLPPLAPQQLNLVVLEGASPDSLQTYPDIVRSPQPNVVFRSGITPPSDGLELDSFFDVFLQLPIPQNQPLVIDQGVAEPGESPVPLLFGNVDFEAFGNGGFIPSSGDSDNTSGATPLTGPLVITTPDSGGTSTVTIEAGTIITRTDTDPFALSDLSIAAPGEGTLAGLTSGVVVGGTIQWGIVNHGLTFSTPITVSIFVGTGLNGTVLDIVRSTTGNSGWTNTGITPTTCTVTTGLCTFTATQASYYAATYTPAPAPIVSSGGGGGGIPSLFGLTTANTNASQTVVGGTGSGGSGAGGGGQVLGVSTNTGSTGSGSGNTGGSGISFFSTPSAGGAPVAIEIGGGEVLGDSVMGDENELGKTSPKPLAAAGSAFDFDMRLWGLIGAAVLLLLIAGYFIFRTREVESA